MAWSGRSRDAIAGQADADETVGKFMVTYVSFGVILLLRKLMKEGDEQ